MSQLSDLRDQLKMGLAERPPEGLMPVAELAERIQVPRAANTVEAAPERVGTRKSVRAERPVTTRIRERRTQDDAGQTEIGTSSENRREVQVEQESAGHAGATVVEPVQEPEEPLAASMVIATLDPVFGFRQSVKERRRGNESQLRMF